MHKKDKADLFYTRRNPWAWDKNKNCCIANRAESPIGKRCKYLFECIATFKEEIAVNLKV